MALRDSEPLLTVEAFELLLTQPDYRDRPLELIDGRIIEKMATFLHGIIAGLFFMAIQTWINGHTQAPGWVAVEARFRVPGDKRNSRLPDVAYYQRGEGRKLVRQGAVPGMPDLAIEIQSPDDSVAGLRAKAAYYLANGTRLVWLIYPADKLVEIYWANGEIAFAHEADTLEGGDVLPGFAMPLKPIFNIPEE